MDFSQITQVLSAELQMSTFRKLSPGVKEISFEADDFQNIKIQIVCSNGSNDIENAESIVQEFEEIHGEKISIDRNIIVLDSNPLPMPLRTRIFSEFGLRKSEISALVCRP